MAVKRRPSHAKVEIHNEIYAVILLALGLFLFLSLFSFNPKDPGFNAAADTTTINNWAGLIGAYTSDIFITIFGIISFIAPPFILLLAALQFTRKQIKLKWYSTIGSLLLLIAGSAFIHLKWPEVTIDDKLIPGGGLIGGLIGELLLRYLNRPGAYLATVTLSFISFSLASSLSPITIIVKIGHYLKIALLYIGNKIPIVLSAIWELIYDSSIKLALAVKKLYAKNKKRAAEKYVDLQVPSKPKPKIKIGEPPKIIKPAEPKKIVMSEEQLAFAPLSSEEYTPPPVSLLENTSDKRTTPSNDILQKNSIIVEKKLSDFGVTGNVTAIHPGPVITMYEFEPAAGTKVSKIANLEDDLSLTLGGKNVRIIAHLPGKAAVGIEVPNSHRDPVGLKEIITAPAYKKTPAKLPIALGVTADGHPMVTDLAKMPHLLIAGATGSGKSVAINALITGLIYKLPPEQLRMIMVDPKMLELSTYQGIPHLLLPVVTKPRLAVRSLRWAVKEMERRYKLLSDAGARNLSAYNNKIANEKIEVHSEEEALKILAQDPEAIVHKGHLPYIVIIVDEMADLMMTASQDMEELVVRLAQMARAAGIHLILATQRPSVDVVTGLIKANFPARISFKVTSRHDSRTILDSNGAESLLGAGDMLYMTPSGNNLLRLHGAYISETEVSRVVNHLQDQGNPTYDDTILQTKDEDPVSPNGSNPEDEDAELYDQALQIVSTTKHASISLIQRRLRIGYNRAARLIEKMETQGVVGPADGSKPRQVLINSL